MFDVSEWHLSKKKNNMVDQGITLDGNIFQFARSLERPQW